MEKSLEHDDDLYVLATRLKHLRIDKETIDDEIKLIITNLEKICSDRKISKGHKFIFSDGKSLNREIRNYINYDWAFIEKSLKSGIWEQITRPIRVVDEDKFKAALALGILDKSVIESAESTKQSIVYKVWDARD